MSEDINVGAISEALNNKMDRDGMNAGNPACVITETYHDNNGNWYRVYSDGWCEQGGCIASPSNENNNVTFLKAFNNNNYYFNRINYSTTNGIATNFACEGYSNKTNSSITIYLLTDYASTIYWEAKGYIR